MLLAGRLLKTKKMHRIRIANHLFIRAEPVTDIVSLLKKVKSAEEGECQVNGELLYVYCKLWELQYYTYCIYILLESDEKVPIDNG
jgi:hypothetical protein